MLWLALFPCLQTPSIPPLYQGRTLSAERRLELGVSTPDGLAMAQRARRWLSDVQGEDGSFTPDGRPGEGDVQATSTALLALLTDISGPTESAIKAAAWLAEAPEPRETRAILLRASALNEASILLGTPSAEVAGQAVDQALSLARDGSWDGDPDLTAWGASLLQACPKADRAPRLREECLTWLRQATHASGAVKRKRGAPGEAGRALCAVYLARRVLGDRQVPKALAHRVGKLALPAWPPSPSSSEPVDLEAWYWQYWALGVGSFPELGAMRFQWLPVRFADALWKGQDEKGAWPPSEGLDGAVESTAMALLILGVPVQFSFQGADDPDRSQPIYGPALPAQLFVSLSVAALRQTLRPYQSQSAWLGDRQRADGAFGGIEETALTLLALGSNPKLRESVERGAAFLESVFDGEQGRFSEEIATHALATAALARSLREDSPAQRREMVQAALQTLLSLRSEDGTFGSATGWGTWALVAAGNAGLEIPPGVLPSLRLGLSHLEDPALAAFALTLARGYDPDLLHAFGAHPPSARSEILDQLYGLYTAHYMPDDAWIEVSSRLRAAAIKRVDQDGSCGGDLRATALNALILSAPAQF